jgi:hypothetical protein
MMAKGGGNGGGCDESAVLKPLIKPISERIPSIGRVGKKSGWNWQLGSWARQAPQPA